MELTELLENAYEETYDETLFNFAVEVEAKEIRTIFDAISDTFAYPHICEIKKLDRGNLWRITFEQIDGHKIGEFVGTVKWFNGDRGY